MVRLKNTFNNLTSTKKLDFAIFMAKSLADLHGFKGGPIIHADTHIEQWLIAPDGSTKLNDFNNAKTARWHQENQEYCTSSGSYGGTYRSPEEFAGNPQDEGVDTYALSSNIYTMVSTSAYPTPRQSNMRRSFVVS